MSDVAPPRRISIRSAQPFAASSEGMPPCRVTTLTGPFAGVINDSVFVTRVDTHVRAPDQSEPCQLQGRTGVATAELTFGSQVLAEKLNVQGLLLGLTVVVAAIAISMINLGGFLL